MRGICVTILLLVSLTVQAQLNYKSGVIYTIAGDTIRAYVGIEESYRDALSYQEFLSRSNRFMPLRDVRAFTVGGRYFEHIEFENKRYLMEAATNGAIRLFPYLLRGNGRPQSLKPASSFPPETNFKVKFDDRVEDMNSTNFNPVMVEATHHFPGVSLSNYSEVVEVVRRYNQMHKVMQSRRTLTVRVLDLETRDPVRDAEIQIPGTDIQTRTNALGFFQLTVDTVNVVSIRHPGYETSLIELPKKSQFSTLLNPTWFQLPSFKLRHPGSVRLSREDSLARIKLDSILTEVHPRGGWANWYSRLENGLTKLSLTNFEDDSLFQFRFGINTVAGITGTTIRGVRDSARQLVIASLGVSSDWEIKSGPVNTWRFSIAEASEGNELAAYPRDGMQGFYKYVERSIQYPDLAKRNKVEGIVKLRADVDTKGSLTNIRVIDGIGSGCDEEAVRVLTHSPKWMPGLRDGIPVTQPVTLTVAFVLDPNRLAAQGGFHTQDELLEAFYAHLASNMIYPLGALSKGVEGTVLVRFVIRSSHKLESLEIVRDIGAGCAAEVMRAVEKTPPAMILAFEPKDKMITLPVHFMIEKGTPQQFPALESGTYVLPTLSIRAGGVSRDADQGASTILMRSVFERNVIQSQGTFEEARTNPDIVEVRMKNQRLTDIPSYVGSLKQLRIIDLENNQITTIPASFGNLTKLEELFLPGNQLQILPASLTTLQSMKVLGMANNNFKEFPAVLLTLSKLQAIDLAGNQISVLPPAIGTLKKLESLYLQDNQLTTLPEGIFQLPKLKVLYLEGNRFSDDEKNRIISRLKKIDLKF